MEAYETLGDAARRAAYDAGQSNAPLFEQGAPWEEVLGRVVDAVVGPRDIRARAGQDHQYRVTLTTVQAARGCKQSLELPSFVSCEVCDGRGFPLEVFPTVCERCQGAGSVEHRRSLRRVVDHCEGCQGLGYLVSKACSACGGARSQEIRQSVVIEVPAGVSTGERLVVRGAGAPGVQGGASGDCFVIVTVAPHPLLTVVGRDVTMVRPVSVFEAMAGGWITVPTLDGRRRLRLPAHTKDGDVLRMPGLGVGAQPDARGDQLVTLMVEQPAALDEEAREQLRSLSQRLGLEAFPKTTRFDEDMVSEDEQRVSEDEHE